MGIILLLICDPILKKEEKNLKDDASNENDLKDDGCCLSTDDEVFIVGNLLVKETLCG